MNIKHTRLAALSPNTDVKKTSQEKEPHIMFRQIYSSQAKPASYQNSNNQFGLGSSNNANMSQSITQQPMSAQAVRQLSIKNSSNPQFGVGTNQAMAGGQENWSMMTGNVQGLLQGNRMGKMQKSLSVQKHSRINPMLQNNNNLRSIKNLQIGVKTTQGTKENVEFDSYNPANLEQQPGIRPNNNNSNGNILNIQFKPSSSGNMKEFESETDKKQSLPAVRLPKLQAPQSGKDKEKNSKNQQKLNNFVDGDTKESEQQSQLENKSNIEKKKDPDLERIKDRFKIVKTPKEASQSQETREKTPPSENGMNGQTQGNKREDELSKIYGGTQKVLRSITPKQNGINGLVKPAVSTLSLSVTQSGLQNNLNNSNPATFMNSANNFTSKHPPKKSSIAQLQQKQLRLFENTASATKNSTINVKNIANNNNNNNAKNSVNNSKLKDESEDVAKRDGPLYVSSYAQRSKAGCNYQGPKKNQDNFIVYPNLNKLPNRYLFSVCDGHGVNGHDVSGFIRQTFPKILETMLAKDINCLDVEYVSSCFKLAYLQLSQKLLESKIDCTFSGSTFVSVLMIDDKIWCANTGDSRGIMCKQTKALWQAEPLSFDHKADDPEEKKRIEASGGRVDSYRDYNGDPVGPARVWMKYDDIPGLAMSRSFGDLIAAQCGVICEPEIKYFEIEDDDRFIVIASDGVWEFLSNRQVMVLAMPYYIRQQPDLACQKIVKESTASWKQHDDVVDDITALCVFLHKNKPQKMNKEQPLEDGYEIQQEEEQEQEQDQQKEDQEKKDSNNTTKAKAEEGALGESKEGDQFLTMDIKPGFRQGAEYQIRKSERLNMKQKNDQNAQRLSLVEKQSEETNNKKAEQMEEKQNGSQNNTEKHEKPQDVKKSHQGKATSNNGNEQIKEEIPKNKDTVSSSQNEKKKPKQKENQLDSDDSEYSRDFELDRQRAQQDEKNEKASKQEAKMKQEKKDTQKGNNRGKYNFDQDDGDDDAFFRNL